MAKHKAASQSNLDKLRAVMKKGKTKLPPFPEQLPQGSFLTVNAKGQIVGAVYEVKRGRVTGWESWP